MEKSNIIKGYAMFGYVALKTFSPSYIDEEFDRFLDKNVPDEKEQEFITNLIKILTDEVAAVILKVAEMENPPLRIRTSEWAEDFTKLKTESDPDGKLINKKVKDMFL